MTWEKVLGTTLYETLGNRARLSAKTKWLDE